MPAESDLVATVKRSSPAPMASTDTLAGSTDTGGTLESTKDKPVVSYIKMQEDSCMLSAEGTLLLITITALCIEACPEALKQISKQSLPFKEAYLCCLQAGCTSVQSAVRNNFTTILHKLPLISQYG